MTSLTYLLSGVNIGVAFIVLLIAWKSRRDRSYFLFGILSLFSGLYFLSATIQAYEIVTILFAAIYYAAFVLFISDFARLKKPIISAILVILFMFAFVLFLIDPNGNTWQLVAHIGLLGIVIYLIYASIQLYRNQHRSSLVFWIVSILFSLLALEEISSIQFGAPLFSQHFTAFPPLDIFPFLFTIIIARRLAFDFFEKSELELELVQAQLREEQAKVQESERKRLESELAFKQKDLTGFGLEIARKKDITEHTYQRLLALKDSFNQESTDLNDLIIYTKSQLRLDKELALLHQNADKINHEFVSLLKKKYPSLTDSEMHLASLLRLKLSTKEIASIKNITPDSVKVLRYRLRKKLNLPKNSTLPEFFINLS